jgi:hypothetical protein
MAAAFFLIAIPSMAAFILAFVAMFIFVGLFIGGCLIIIGATGKAMNTLCEKLEDGKAPVSKPVYNTTAIISGIAVCVIPIALVLLTVFELVT